MCLGQGVFCYSRERKLPWENVLVDDEGLARMPREFRLRPDRKTSTKAGSWVEKLSFLRENARPAPEQRFSEGGKRVGLD